MRRFLRIVIATLSLYISTHVVAFSMLPIALFHASTSRMDNFLQLKTNFSKNVFRVIRQKIQISGLENINPESHYLIVANYPSGYAPFALMNVFPRASFVAHEFISKIPLLGSIMKQTGTIFVDWKYPVRGFREIGMALEKGKSGDLIIMPEGQRSSDGKIHSFKRGFIYILKHSHLDLLPITLNGFYKLKPANRFFMDPDTRLELLVGKPISNKIAIKISDHELIAMVEKSIQAQYQP